MFEKLLSTTIQKNRLDLALLILRIGISVLMLTHGYPKLQTLLSGQGDQFPDPLMIGNKSSLILTVIAEFFCSILLILGLFTRFSLFTLLICMAVAAFIFHYSEPFDEKEHALLFLLPYIILWLTGPGKYSLDNMWLKK